MRVKVCGIRNEQDLKAASASGADALGFLVGQVHASADFILSSTAARLIKMMPPYIVPVLVTHLTCPASIMEIVMQVGISTIQLHGGSSPAEVEELRELMPPGSKLILAAHVVDNQIVPNLQDYYKTVDAILLDSLDKENGKVGGTGRAHNWAVSKAFVKTCPLPVTLAGGLTPKNVASAIDEVHPFAVDANSGMKNSDGMVDSKICAEFVRLAKEAGQKNS